MTMPGCCIKRLNKRGGLKNLVSLLSILGLTLLSQNYLSAQNKTRIKLIQADQLMGDQSTGQDLNIFVGNVIFEHDSAFLFCDSAIFQGKTNYLEAHQKVHIKMSDTLNLYGDVLYYDGNTRKATIIGNVILEDNDATLTTDKLIYERNSKIAYYATGGRIINQDNVLTSLKGYYYTDEKQLYFKENVVLINPEYELQSDTLIFNTATEIAYISGPTTIIGEEEFLYAEDGWYDTKSDASQLRQNPYMTYKEQYLSGDQIFYEKETGIGEVFGNVFIKDSVQNIIITGQYADYHRNDGFAYATDSATVIMIDKNDSLFLHADTLRLTFDSTNSPEYLLAYNKCKFYKTDFQGMSDSLVYSFADSTIDMYYKPVLWTRENQITAELIKIYTSNQAIDSMQMTNSSFIISMDKFDPDKYNQIKGKNMLAFFADNELNIVKVNGNSETIYFVREETGSLIGVNRAASSKMEIWISDRQVTDIFYFDSPSAKLKPENEVMPEDLILRDFKWRGDARPYSKYDIYVWPDDFPVLR